MRGELTVVWVACAVGLGLGPPASPGSLRAETVRLRLAVERSQEDSRTFAALSATLKRHNVIVYITSGSCDLGRRDACLLHYVTTGSGYRYLRIVIRDTAPPARLAGQLAHELQHAVEVAESNAANGSAVAALFRRIGSPCAGQHLTTCYETEAAISVQYQVLAEINAARRRSR
ncbi:MAG: hypothetical protein NTY02_02465 [Acidobacteria bacterium]|nr:hypothetical protein [Acidobacteriota bacterium]